MRKKILWVGESSFVNSGYGIYTKQLLPQLVNSGKYEVAELSCYGKVNDPRNKSLPWYVYDNAPANQEEGRLYQRNKYCEFGAYKFDDTCIDFKPDVVLAIRDAWMDSHIIHSPLKPFFSTVMMPTCDSVEQSKEWIADYMDVDTILTYTDFSKDVLEKESSGLIKVDGVPGMGIDFNAFKPIENKKQHKIKYGLSPDMKIIGTVMRNQRRKLFPDLIESFAKFCEQNPELSQNIYLYLHTSYPDLGWDLPRLVKESGISHKILFTYRCKRCQKVFIVPFQDARTTCINCGSLDCILPNVHDGVSNVQLGEIYNLFDLYVQYSIAEGLGISQLEAAACSIPFMSTNYSAMESIVKNLHGIPINIQKYFREPESHSYRVYPDDEHFIQKLCWFFNLPEQLQLKMGRDSYTACKKLYNWDTVTQKWMDAIDNVPSPQLSWSNTPPRLHKPNLRIPPNLNNLDFIRWCFVNILGDPSKINSYWETKYLRNLNYGVSIDGTGGLHTSELSDPMFSQKHPPFNRDQLIKMLIEGCERNNHCEQKRVNYNPEMAPDFIKLAHCNYNKNQS
jgi:glycosyltransferase involved in cell wall biosynthesis